jgi:hypothetical protein
MQDDLDAPQPRDMSEGAIDGDLLAAAAAAPYTQAEVFQARAAASDLDDLVQGQLILALQGIEVHLAQSRAVAGEDRLEGLRAQGAFEM